MYVINSKSEFMDHAVRENPWNTTHFAWVDFNLTHVFKEKLVSLRFLKDTQDHIWKSSCFLIPGCWGKYNNIHHGHVTDCIHWRFCGGFFLGDAKSIQKFHRLYMSLVLLFYRVYIL